VVRDQRRLFTEPIRVDLLERARRRAVQEEPP
jgi:hypothetical protein